jgi:hypothetical protein
LTPTETTAPAATANNTHEGGGITTLGFSNPEPMQLYYVKITNLVGSTSCYLAQNPEKVLQQEQLKRQKYQDICETCQELFHLFIASTDGMLASEVTSTKIWPTSLPAAFALRW